MGARNTKNKVSYKFPSRPIWPAFFCVRRASEMRPDLRACFQFFLEFSWNSRRRRASLNKTRPAWKFVQRIIFRFRAPIEGRLCQKIIVLTTVLALFHRKICLQISVTLQTQTLKIYGQTHPYCLSTTRFFGWIWKRLDGEMQEMIKIWKKVEDFAERGMFSFFPAFCFSIAFIYCCN